MRPRLGTHSHSGNFFFSSFYFFHLSKTHRLFSLRRTERGNSQNLSVLAMHRGSSFLQTAFRIAQARS